MTDAAQTSSPSAATIVRGTPARDDSGSETMARFEWQCAMAAADLLSAYDDSLQGGAPVTEAFELICEHHEDWVLVDGPAAEIVSAKHLEREFGTYSTLKQLLDEGGLLHLLDRWLALGRSPRCRLVTTPSLSGDARRLEKACAHFAIRVPTSDFGEHEELLEKLSIEISRRRAVGSAAGSQLPPEGAATLASFLGCLRLDHSRPFRNDLVFSAGDRFAKPVADALGASDASDAIWEALLNVVRERMRASGPNRRASLPRVLGARDEPQFEERMLSLRDVAVIVRVAIENQSGFRRLPQPVLTSKVAAKMSAGGCSDTAIARAESLRLQYRSHWRGETSGPARLKAQRAMENALHRIADEESSRVSLSHEAWGPQLWTAVQSRTDDLEGNISAQGLDSNLLLGGIADLSNRCLVWFSPRFDVSEAMQVRAREASS